jgi:AmiR/NasT family two-component response regulator
MISRDNGMTMASIRPALYERALAVLGEKYGIREELASEALIKCAMAWRMSVRDAAQRIVDRADAKQPPST